MKRGDTNGLEWSEDKYQQYQHSGQRREQPVASFVAKLTQITAGVQRHRKFLQLRSRCPCAPLVRRVLVLRQKQAQAPKGRRPLFPKITGMQASVGDFRPPSRQV